MGVVKQTGTDLLDDHHHKEKQSHNRKCLAVQASYLLGSMSDKLGIRNEFIINFGLEVISKHGLGLGTLLEQTADKCRWKSMTVRNPQKRHRQSYLRYIMQTNRLVSDLQFHHLQTSNFFVVIHLFQFLYKTRR